MTAYVWVALGGALGSVARYWASTLAVAAFGASFPWGTLIVNVVGSLIIGVAGAMAAPETRWTMPDDVRTFVMVGICGGFTTFSSFSLQTYALLLEGEVFRAVANTVLSVVLCLLAVWAGYAAASRL
ncbi:MAG TPA: fluoride efflux transporter CrcB [Azospirillum sp.]|nr:fluoride efflux transporter CrcB [Azospirillum sp.]